jgi:hypothetical protein
MTVLGADIHARRVNQEAQAEPLKRRISRV